MIKNLVFDLGGVIVPLNRVACIRAFNEVVGYKDFGDVLRSYRQVGYFCVPTGRWGISRSSRPAG